MLSRPLPPAVPLVGAAALAGITTLVALVLAQRMGLVVLGLGGAALAAILLLERPALAVGVLVAAVLLLESSPDAAFSGSVFYERPGGLPVYPVEILAVLALAAVLADAAHRGSLSGAAWLVAPLGLLGLAIVGGVVTGSAAGADTETLQEALRTPVLLLVVPLVAAHALGSAPVLRRFVAGAAVLTGVKAVLGLAALVLALGPVALDDVRATYLESAANLAAMTVVFGALALRFARVATPRWVDAVAVLALASLVLSYRRSFWIATVAGVVLLVALALSPRGRAVIAPAVVVAGLAGGLVFSGGATVELSGPVGDRLAQLSPTQLRSDPQDRYRLGERANVLEEIRRSPVAGIGLGVEWRAFEPLSLENDGGRRYVHVAALWFWLKLGLLGLLAYVGLVAGALVAGVGAWRRHPDPVLAAAALAGGVAVVGLAIAETTATFTGADPRATVLLGVLLGALAAVRADAGRAPVVR